MSPVGFDRPYNIVVNPLVLTVFWYVFAFGQAGHNPVGYWIIAPSSAMLIENISADMPVRSDRGSLKENISILLIPALCTLPCIRHKIVAVLLTSFIMPAMLSALYADVKMAGRAYLLAQAPLIPSGFWMRVAAADGAVDGADGQRACPTDGDLGAVPAPNGSVLAIYIWVI